MRRQHDEADGSSDQLSMSSDVLAASTLSGAYSAPHILPDRLDEVNAARHRRHLDCMCRMLELKEGPNYQTRDNELVNTPTDFVVGVQRVTAAPSVAGSHAPYIGHSEQPTGYWTPYSAMAAMNGAMQTPMYAYYNPSLGLYAMPPRNMMNMPRMDGSMQMLAPSFALQQHFYHPPMSGSSGPLPDRGLGLARNMRPYTPFPSYQASLPSIPNVQSKHPVDNNDHDSGPPRKVSKPSPNDAQI